MNQRLTAADLKGRKLLNPVHIDYARGLYAWMGRVDGADRLGMAYGRDHQGPFRRWSVDDKWMPNLEAALAVINGDMTFEEAMVQFAPPATRPKLSLTAQIAEIDYELKQRESVYGRIAGGTPSRKSELEQHVENLKAVRATLVWLQDNEDRIKQRFSY